MSVPSRRGYVLLEAMVALVLVSIGLAGLMHALRLSLAAARHATHLTIACHLAEQKLAELRAIPPNVVGLRDGDFGPDQPIYRWRTHVRPVPQKAFHSVLVEVWWLERGQPRSVALGSLIDLQPAERTWRSIPQTRPSAVSR